MPEISLLLLSGTFVAGLLMFFAPCTFPLVPPFLAYIGTVKGELYTRGSIFLNAVAFCVGFSVIFILLGLGVGLLGAIVQPLMNVFNILVGVMIALLGATLLGWVSFNSLQKNIGFPIPNFLMPGTPSSAFIIGVLFALGFSPCIGPVMATVLLIASTEGSSIEGGILLSVFSLGLSIPFLLTAAFYAALKPRFALVTPKQRYVQVVSGSLLLLIGLLFIFGGQTLLFTLGNTLFYWVGLDFLFTYY